VGKYTGHPSLYAAAVTPNRVTECIYTYNIALNTVQVFSCRNHVRAVLRMQDRLFVCTTGADAPAVYYLDVTTSLHLIVNLVVV